MSYSQNWVENQPTSATAANTIYQYWQNNQIAIRERLDSLFGTSNFATADPYKAAVFNMSGQAASRIIGGATSWGTVANDGVTDNLVVNDNGDTGIRGNLTVLGNISVSGSTFTGALNFTGNITMAGNLTVTGQAVNVEYNNGNSGGIATINWNNSSNQKITLTGSPTLTFTNPGSAGAVYILRLIQDATGSRTVSWPAEVRWFGVSAPTLTTTPLYSDLITFYWNGTYYLATVGGLGASV